MKRKTLAFLLADFFLALFLIVSIFPSFSKQDPIDPQSLTGEFEEGEKLAVFNNQEISTPQIAYGQIVTPLVLGQTNANKRIEIDLTNQRLYAYEGTSRIFNFLISSGKWGRTPTGAFLIWAKLRFTKMSGGSKELGTYYYLPNVPYTMFFYNGEVAQMRGYGIHGTYWHNNFGHPMSHGCINMKTEEAGLLYSWADPYLSPGQKIIRASADNPGTEIIIYGQAPAV